PAGRRVVLRVDAACRRAVGVGEVEQATPVLSRQHPLVARDRGRWIYGPVAGEDAVSQEAVGALVDRELEVTVDVPVADAVGERLVKAIDPADVDDALQYLCSGQPQRDGRD